VGEFLKIFAVFARYLQCSRDICSVRGIFAVFAHAPKTQPINLLIKHKTDLHGLEQRSQYRILRFLAVLTRFIIQPIDHWKTELDSLEQRCYHEAFPNQYPVTVTVNLLQDSIEAFPNLLHCSGIIRVQNTTCMLIALKKDTLCMEHRYSKEFLL
jgi:hypothetical protein